MITFIFIFGVLFRVVPMIAVLWLIWHVSRKPTATGLLRESEEAAAYNWPQANVPVGKAAKRSARAGRPFASIGKPTRRVRELSPLSAPPTGAGNAYPQP